MIFSSGSGAITFDASGQVTSVAHRDRPQLSYLSGLTVGTLSVAGRRLPLEPPETSADLDEVEFAYSCPGALRLVVRHTFAAGWGVRLALSSLADRPQLVDRVELALRCDPGCVAWAAAMGDTGAYAVARADGTSPLLGGQLRLGALERVTGTGLELGGIELQPGGRYVVQLKWDWYDSPRSFGLRQPPESPSSLFVFTGESVQLDVTDDVAVVAPADVAASQVGGRLELTSELPGRYPFELRSARGTTRFELEWVAPVQDQLAQRAVEALARPRSASGVVKLAGVADALVVQHLLGSAGLADPEDAAEALDLFTARLRGTGGLSSLETAYLCREYDRNGDLDLLAEARDAVLAHASSAPGLGMAATQLCLGLIVSGQPVSPVLDHLVQLVHRLDEADVPLPGAAGASAGAAALELVTVTSAGPGASGFTPGPVEVSLGVTSLGLQLGGGMCGEAVSPLPVAQLSHLIAVLQLLPDGVSAQHQTIWGCSAHALAARSVPALLARLQTTPNNSALADLHGIAEAHAWLVLALQDG